MTKVYKILTQLALEDVHQRYHVHGDFLFGTYIAYEIMKESGKKTTKISKSKYLNNLCLCKPQ